VEIRKLVPTTDWIEFALEDGQSVRFKLRMMDSLDDVDIVAEGDKKPSSILLAKAITAIVDWNLTTPDGAAIPCTETSKTEYAREIRAVLASMIAGGKGFLAVEVGRLAQDAKLFLGN
jgi:hypothetical protein